MFISSNMLLTWNGKAVLNSPPFSIKQLTDPDSTTQIPFCKSPV
jgi:hypothetical protein